MSGFRFAQTVGGRCDFRAAHVAGAEKHLALQIREIHDVEIDQADAADAGRREIKSERRAEAAGADAKHFRLLQLQLTFHAHFRHDQVAAVAQDFFFRKRWLPAVRLCVFGAIETIQFSIAI